MLALVVCTQHACVALCRQLLPVASVLACVCAQEVYLKMKGKLFSLTDSSDITYLNGAPYARLRGRMMSVKDKHTVECLDGTPLFNVKNVSCLSPNAG